MINAHKGAGRTRTQYSPKRTILRVIPNLSNAARAVAQDYPPMVDGTFSVGIAGDLNFLDEICSDSSA